MRRSACILTIGLAFGAAALADARAAAEPAAKPAKEGKEARDAREGKGGGKATPAAAPADAASAASPASAGGAAGPAAGGKLDLNSASAADIARALDVSDSLALRIVEKRPYEQLGDLVVFNLISQKDFDAKGVKKKFEVRPPKKK
jgi:DNA uptake protein ComE-like DNA-binding protein